MRERYLAVVILQQVRKCALQNARRSATKARCMFAEFYSAASGLNSDQADARIGDELVEGSDGVGAAADTGDDRGWQPAFLLLNLLAGLFADHTMKVAHHGRIRMRSQHAA